MNGWINILISWLISKIIGFWFWTIIGVLVLTGVTIGYLNSEEKNDGSIIVKV